MTTAQARAKPRGKNLYSNYALEYHKLSDYCYFRRNRKWHLCIVYSLLLLRASLKITGKSRFVCLNYRLDELRRILGS